MSGRTEPPDWLDELYQEGHNDGPPASVDANIRAAARGQSSARPWYLRARSLASAATIILGLGITALWLGEADLAELAAPPTQAPSAELRQAVQPIKRQLQTSASDELREEETTGTPLAATQKSALPALELEQQKTRFQTETVITQADAEPEAARLSAARSTPASAAEFELNAGSDIELARRAAAQSPLTDSDNAVATGLAEISAAPASPALSDRVQPEDCAELTLIDVGTAAPYALCRLQDDQLRIRHPSCPQALELSDQTVTADRDTRSLIITDHEERSQLICNPQTGTWLLEPLPATRLQQ